MRILELNDEFPITDNFTKYLRKLGHEVDYIRRNVTREKIPSKKYDIIHVHYALNLSTIRFFLGKKVSRNIVLHLHGSDVRNLPLKYRLILEFEKFRAKLVLFSTPDLAQWTNGLWIPNIIDFEKFKVINKPVYKNRVLVHVSKHPIKNMELIHRVVQELKEFKFDFLEGVPYKKVPNIIKKYPLVLGQLSGSYGASELEAMACGIPTVFYVSPRIKPMIGCETPSLASLNLRYIVRFIRKHIGDLNFGRKQRKFVERFHHPLKITRLLVQIFEGIVKGEKCFVDK